MLATLLAWLYISFVCWSWGSLAFQIINKTASEKNTLFDFSFVCLTGLVLITGIVSLLSIFFAIGDTWVQLIILVPALFIVFRRKSYTLLKNEIIAVKKFNLLPKILFITCLLFLLVISSTYITNLDTIGYHAQTIKWIEKYKAIPGLVHLHRRYGYQGLWYVTAAFFNFSFLKSNLATFVNTSVLVWFFLFVVKKINFYSVADTKKEKNYFFFWIALLALNFLSYNQLRLVATTPSPDFIAVIYTWAIFYLFLNNELILTDTVRNFIIILFSSFALTIKLSVLPIAIFALLAFINFILLKKIKPLFVTIGISLLLLISFVTRNIITTGYIVFPSAAIDVINADWKYDRSLTELEKNYITAYARTHVSYTKEKVEAVMNMNLTNWVPQWWKTINPFDKIILLLTIVAAILFLFNLKKIVVQKRKVFTALLIAMGGILFWFIQAPDPRFGFGFLIPFIAMAAIMIRQNDYLINLVKIKPIYRLSLLVPIVCIIAYTAYWFEGNQPKNIVITPNGLKAIPFKTIQINGNSFNIPADESPCAGTPIPCVYDSCQTFTPRGKNITDGFKAKEGYHPTSWKL